MSTTLLILLTLTGILLTLTGILPAVTITSAGFEGRNLGQHLNGSSPEGGWTNDWVTTVVSRVFNENSEDIGPIQIHGRRSDEGGCEDFERKRRRVHGQLRSLV